jgi:N-ethylmaleimide reductase
VTDAVHARGGTIFAQLMHTGRISHPSLLPDGLIPVAPSSVAAAGQVFTYQGPQDYVKPKKLDQDDITHTIADYADASPATPTTTSPRPTRRTCWRPTPP